MNCDPLARWYRWLEYLGMGRALERRRFEFLPELVARGGNEQTPAGGGSARAEPVPNLGAADSHGQIEEPSLPSGNEPLRGKGRSGSTGRALVLGDGDGRFLERFLAAQPAVRVDYVDSSAKMLALARKRTAGQFGAQHTAGRVTFHHADARQWLPADEDRHDPGFRGCSRSAASRTPPGCAGSGEVPGGLPPANVPHPSGVAGPACGINPENRYDFIFTHFFLDCLTDREVHELLRRLVPFATPTAVWIVSEFHQPPGGFAGWRARMWIGGLYRLFGLTTGLKVRRLPDYRRSLQAQGFRMQREVLAEAGLLVSEWWQRQR